MTKETNMEAIKAWAKALLDVKIRTGVSPDKNIFIRHPFYGDNLQPCQDSNGEIQRLDIFESPENLAKARAFERKLSMKRKMLYPSGICLIDRTGCSFSNL